MGFRALVLGLLAACLLAFSACGSDDTSGNSSATTTSEKTDATAAELRRQRERARERRAEARRVRARERRARAQREHVAGRRQAERFIRRYYKLLNGREFDEAWATLAPGLRAQFGPREHWEAGYELTEGTTPTSVVTRTATADNAKVFVTFRSDDLDECGDHVAQRFEGIWWLTRTARRWLAADADIKKIGGAEPERDPEECGDSWTPVSPPANYAPPEDGFTYVPDPDPGEPLYVPPADFCDTHDCIPNFYNGTGYPVMCDDGTWSDSGGRPGACSWHGGVSEP